MAEFSQFTDTQVERFLEDWDAPEPETNQATNLGVSTGKLFARYSYYTRLVQEKAKWERECSQYNVDFESILLDRDKEAVDPEQMIRVFVHEKLPNGELLRLTENPMPARLKAIHEAEPVIPEVDELEIPLHVINRKRKKKNPSKDIRPADNTAKSVEVQACFPVQIGDITGIKIERDTFDKYEIYGMPCRLITFFGRICGVRRNEKHNQRIGIYEVDDGSGKILVHFNHLKKEFKESFLDVANVEQAIRLKRNRVTTRIGSISEDIRKLLYLCRARLQHQINYYKLGDRAMILGVPFRMEKDEMRVFAYEMNGNDQADCDFEIYFKDLLFNAYTKRKE